MTALVVDNSTLLVHHIIVLKQVFTDTKVVLLDLLLGILDGARHDRRLDTLSVLNLHAVHNLGDTLGSEEAHEFVFERYIENRRTGVALTAGTTTQLAVYTTALVALGTDDGETTCSLDLGRELDVGTTTCHIGGNGHGAQSIDALSGLGHNVGLTQVVLGIEHLVGYLAKGKHTAQQL